MRIIAGQRRGHKIEGPRITSNTRPTSDMVRESLFNILGELVEGRTFIDLFAGTGAVGLEALSRGAAMTIFVELDRENVGLIFRNVATLHYENQVRVRHADSYRWVRTFELLDDTPAIVFLDPPYRDYENRTAEVNRLLTTLTDKLPAGSVIAFEAGRGMEALTLPKIEWDVRRYGNKRIAVGVLPDRGEEWEVKRAEIAEPDSAADDDGASTAEES